MGMTVYQIQKGLRIRALGSGRRIMAPNICCLSRWEADWLEVTQAGYAYEYEIKLSRSDYNADFHKVRRKFKRVSRMEWSYDNIYKHDLLSGKVEYDKVNLPKRFYFVYPEGMIDADQVPEHAGIIECKPYEEARQARYYGCRTRLVRQAKDVKASKKLEQKHYRAIATSLQERFFTIWMNGNGHSQNGHS